MFGSVAEGIEGMKKAAGLGETKTEAESTVRPNRASVDEELAAQAAVARTEAAVADVDARAQTGDVTFDDFLTMARTFSKMDAGGKMDGLPADLTFEQLKETREKFARHEKIVEVMLEDERDDPELLIEDLQAGGSKPGPRIQRLAQASGQPE